MVVQQVRSHEEFFRSLVNKKDSRVVDEYEQTAPFPNVGFRSEKRWAPQWLTRQSRML